MTRDTKTIHEKLDEIHDSVIQINTVLVGIPGTEDKGLVGKQLDHEKRLRRIEEHVPYISLVITFVSAVIASIAAKTMRLFGE